MIHHCSSPRFPPRLTVLLLSVIFASSCAERPPGVEGDDLGGWTRYDLRRHQPRLEEDPGQSFKAQTYPLGRGFLRPKRAGMETRRRVATQVMGIEADSGARLYWQVDLGSEPFLSFIPLTPASEEVACRRTYRVGIGNAEGAWQEILSQEAVSFDHFAPATVEVSLGDWAGQKVEVALQLHQTGECEAKATGIWGSPAVWSRRATLRAPSSERINVVLLGLDTLRADALGVYGHEPSVSPAIDRLAEESDVYLEAFSTFNVTNPSFTSMMTGLYGKNHGVYDLQSPLADEHTTLAEIFHEAGYDTGAMISARHLGDRQSGLAQGFSTYRVTANQYPAEFAVDEAIDWIGNREKPFFLWLHLFDPHTPHMPPEPFASGYLHSETGLGPAGEWRAYREPGQVEFHNPHLGGHHDLYDAEVAYLDRHVGRLLDFLESRGHYEDTLIVLVADHGENLGEYGLDFRHSGLWDTTIKIPFLFRWPGREREGRRISGLVQSLDLFPTVLAAAGLEVPESDGIDLASDDRGRRMVFAEASDGKGAMVRTAEHLLFKSTAEYATIVEGNYFYDLASDPLQTTNLAGSGDEMEERMARFLEAWMADNRGGEMATEISLTAEELDELRALGYLDN